MSLSRQLRRAAGRAQLKAQRKAARLAGNATETAIQGDTPQETSTAEPAPQCSGPTAPRTPEGKAISPLNNLKHGLAGAFRVLESESQSAFDAAHDALIAEHEPATPTEFELIRRMAEHSWLSRRAQDLQDKAVLDCNGPLLALFLRYQTTNDRGFRCCLNDLFRLRREQRAAAKQFESQNRVTEIHEARVRLANARAGNLELDTDIRSTVDAPLPGYSSVPVEEVKELFKSAMLSLKYDKGGKAAA